jgi:hypothetical protein
MARYGIADGIPKGGTPIAGAPAEAMGRLRSFFARGAGDEGEPDPYRLDPDALRRRRELYAAHQRSLYSGRWRIGELDSGLGLALAVTTVVIVVALLLGLTLAI